ncbi:uncharacterized protein [Montipora capricornis]|uniref:uncharacterized protein n=1 Tax=Montipora capricornis TaxID=246305 RepID=UPI0035F13A23
MVNYCSVAGCTNSSRNSPDISFHLFPKDLALRRKWKKFCRRADKGFEKQENPRICAAHFKTSDFKQCLNGRVDVRKGTSPSIFKVAECKENNSPRDRRSEKRKRPERMEDCTDQPLKEARITQLKSAVSAEAVKHDHDYCSHKDFHDKSTQTNFDLPQELQGTKEDLQRLKEENDKLKAKLEDKETLKRELFMGDVLKNDESVKFYTVRIIIDCTEIYIEKPTTPSAKRATWSNYKQHNTIKALAGISPDGMFTFVSKLWTGNSSDRHITEQSGFLDLLEPGDSIMADKGFNIRDLATKKRVLLNVPPLCKGKQLSTKAVKTTRQIASVRIHVERAIERLKNFRLLQGNLPLTLLDIADHILIVCASLCNLLPPLAKW